MRSAPLIPISLVVLIAMSPARVAGETPPIRAGQTDPTDRKETVPQDATPAHLISIDLFWDSISHWRKRYGRDRNDPRYDPSEVAGITGIAENLLRYQNPDGGWPKDIDWLAKIDLAEVRRLKGDALTRSTLDNHNTYSQIEYLSKACALTNDVRYGAAAERGLEYVLNEQRPSGGWRGADVDAITYNDDVMAGAMGLLMDICDKTHPPPHCSWISGERREQAKRALDHAIAVTLGCQIIVNGRRTGWCQQHDHATLAPVRARSFELPSIASDETVGVVRVLMRIEEPSAGVREAIEGAVRWLESAKILNTKIDRFDIEPVRFEFHTATQDQRVVEDPNAPPIWARYYEIETNRPFFCNRDWGKVYSLSELTLERRTGSGWYGRRPEKLLREEYPRWQSGRGAR